MQNLSALLRKLATAQLTLQQLTNRAIANAISLRIKDAAQFSFTDYVDVADYIDDGVAHDTLSAEDIIRLRAVAKLLRDAHRELHLVQDELIVKQQYINSLSFPNSGE